jgi:tryptophanyl-tRNA synthetase
MKKQLAEDMVHFIQPIREKAEEIYANKLYLKQVIENGAVKARESAKRTIELTREGMGLNYL